MVKRRAQAAGASATDTTTTQCRRRPCLGGMACISSSRTCSCSNCGVLKTVRRALPECSAPTRAGELAAAAVVSDKRRGRAQTLLAMHGGPSGCCQVDVAANDANGSGARPREWTARECMERERESIPRESIARETRESIVVVWPSLPQSSDLNCTRRVWALHGLRTSGSNACVCGTAARCS